MLDRTVPPPFQDSDTLTLLQPEILELENGVPVYGIHGGQQEVVKLEIIFEAGRWFEEKSGQSYFTTNALSRGTQTRSSFDIARNFEHYGAHVEFNAGFDFATLVCFVLKDKLPHVCDTFFSLIREATFPEKEIVQLKQIYLENLRVNNEKLSYVASKLLRKELFGAVHPYGREIEEENIPEIQQADLTAFYHSRFVSPKVFVSGNFGDKEISLIARHLQKLGRSSLAPAEQAVPVKGESKRHDPRKDSVQSAIRLGKLMPNRTSPDYMDVVFMSHILGGYFGSRLMRNLREERGLTYGVHASLHAFRHDAYLSIGADVNKDSCALAIGEIRKELDRLGYELITSDELEVARNHFIGSFLSEINTPFAHAEKQKNIVLYGLHEEFYNRMLGRVAEISAEELRQIARTYFREDSFSEVSVG